MGNQEFISMADSATRNRPRKVSRKRTETTERILEAALDVFSRYGFRGATLDQISSGAGISKPNLLYYFDSKEAMHRALLTRLLDTWLDPLKTLDPDGEPIEEIANYVRLKLNMARDYPRESRLFANEIINGAPVIRSALEGELRDLVNDKAALMERWIAEGKIAAVDPRHLIFSIWATTQHYADFSAQIRLVLDRSDDAFDEAAEHLDALFRKMLMPDRGQP